MASLSWSRRTTSTCSLGRLRPSTHQGEGVGGARILEGAALVEPSYGLRLIYREVVDVCLLLTEQTRPSSSGSHAPCPPPPWLRHHLPNHLRLCLDRGAVGSRPSPPLLPSPATTQGPKRRWLPTTALGRLMHYLHTRTRRASW
jgi:hypothetical protein